MPDWNPDSLVPRALARALAPQHLFVQDIALTLQGPVEERIPWEIFRGRLLPPAQTRMQQRFLAWNLGEPGGEPILSVKWDETTNELHVTRSILCRVQEGFHAGDNVYQTREVEAWVRELVGTVVVTPDMDESLLIEEVGHLLFHAVIGTSRLPLTSLESPLPAFSLGSLAYLPHPGFSSVRSSPCMSIQELLSDGLRGARSSLEKIKILEVVLRSLPEEETPAVARTLAQSWREFGWPLAELPGLIQGLFNEVALSPGQGLSAKALRVLVAWQQGGFLTLTDRADVLSHLLRQAARHLMAFDLVRFHSQGANYPDALTLEEILNSYRDCIEEAPDLLLRCGDDVAGRQARRRRRALRQALMIRERYRGHLVPIEPTSEGENVRVLPAPFARVPAEQITQPHRRPRRLFVEEWDLGVQTRRALALSLEDLIYPEELRELGTALHLDRPLGAFKRPGEPDATVLLSHVTFSRILMERGLSYWQGQGKVPKTLPEISEGGVPIDPTAKMRPGVATLADALQAAPDFVVWHTTKRAIHDFVEQYNLSKIPRIGDLSWIKTSPHLVILGAAQALPEPSLIVTLHDEHWKPRLRLVADMSQGYSTRWGIEKPQGAWRILI